MWDPCITGLSEAFFLPSFWLGTNGDAVIGWYLGVGINHVVWGSLSNTRILWNLSPSYYSLIHFASVTIIWYNINVIHCQSGRKQTPGYHFWLTDMLRLVWSTFKDRTPYILLPYVAEEWYSSIYRKRDIFFSRSLYVLSGKSSLFYCNEIFYFQVRKEK